MMGMGMGLPVAKAKDVPAHASSACWASCARRRPASLLVILLAVGSVFFLILGPKLLGEATNVVVAGLFPGSGGLDTAALAGVLIKLAGRLHPELASSPGHRHGSWPASPSAASTGCARRSTGSSAGCRSRPSTAGPGATC